MIVRPAVPADAESIARVHVVSWQESYTHLVPADALASLSIEQRWTEWTAILTDPRAVIAVAVHPTAGIVGWAGSARSDDPSAVRPEQLRGIYVLAAHQGSGAGQQLLDAVLGDRPAFLAVAADNPRAQAFYRRNGFRDDGTRDSHEVAGHPVDVLRMVR